MDLARSVLPRNSRHGLTARGRRAWTGARAICVRSLLLILNGCSMVSLQKDLSEVKGLGLVSGPVTNDEEVARSYVRILDQAAGTG